LHKEEAREEFILSAQDRENGKNTDKGLTKAQGKGMRYRRARKRRKATSWGEFQMLARSAVND